jgi:hypothetical protein
MSNIYSSKPSAKPLKGGTVTSNLGVFDTISANTIVLESINISGVFEDGILLGATIRDSFIDSSVIGAGGATEAYFTNLQTTSTVTFYNQLLNKFVRWDPITSIFRVNGELRVDDCSQLGNLRICSNTINATNLNGDVNIIPNGSGSIYLTGPIYNVVTSGSYYGEYTNGGITQIAKNNIILNSTSASILLTSKESQSLTSVTSDINITSTVGNITLNTPNFIKILDNSKLSFGATCNNIYSSGGNLNIQTCNDLNLEVPNTNKILIPEITKLQFSTVGNIQLFSSSGSLNINGTNTLFINNSLTQINSTNVRFYDPIITLADYNLVSNDTKDRGIEFKYFDIETNSTKLGWFGYKNSTGRFTFITDATNTNETITGTIGNLELSRLVLNNITLSEGGLINANCGSITNLSLITSCQNNLTISAGQNINLESGNRIYLNSQNDILIPNNIPLKFGTTGSTITETSGGNLKLNATTDIYLTTRTSGSVIIPTNTYISFDGSTNGQQRISSNTSGDLNILSNKNIYLTTTGGSIIIPSNTNINLGNSSQSIYGNSGGITILTNSSTSNLNLLTNNNVNINSSFGNINLDSNKGDINLLTSSGNVRIPQNTFLIFNVSGTSNSVQASNGNLIINGSGTNDISLRNTSSINLSATSNVNIPTNTRLNIGSNMTNFIYTDASNNTYIQNTVSNGSLNLTSSALNFNQTTTNITSNSFNITPNVSSGSTVIIDSENVKLKDPILTLANYTQFSGDTKDKGIEYNYFEVTNTSENTLGWFGMKTSTNRFTYLLNATNANGVITGDFGDIEIKSAYMNGDIIFNTRGNLNIACGTLGNVHTITGCQTSVTITTGTINLSGSTSVTIPTNTPLNFGTTGNYKIISDTSGNLTVSSESTTFNTTNTFDVLATNTRFKDPILTVSGISAPISNDLKDRGIEFRWHNNISAKLGYFGYKENTGRFVFIKDATNTNEIISGIYSDVEFGDAYLNNINLNNGKISGTQEISGGEITIKTTSGNISLTPTSGSNVILPFNSKISFGNTTNSISVDTSGNLSINSNGGTTISATNGNLELNSTTAVTFLKDIPVYIGEASIEFDDTTNQLNFTNPDGDIYFNPETRVDIPTNKYLTFGSTVNSIISDGSQLYINGYDALQFSSGNININGNLNITGTLTSSTIDFDLNKYILPLGTNQLLDITNITTNNLSTNGNILITTNTTHNLVLTDSVILKNTNSTPNIDGTYAIKQIVSPTQFTISAGTITSAGSDGTVKSNLTREQGKDVGIQINYWSTVGNTSVTAGTAAFKTGFFGFKRNTERWSFYNNATIANDVVSGSLADIEINKLFTNRISGYILDGHITAGSNAIIGTNFQINGGSFNSTPIGNVNPNSGNFTNLSNTVQAQLTRVSLQSTLIYSLERYTLTSIAPTRSPDATKIVTLFSVQGASFTSSSGTMPSTSITDGTFKMLVCSSMDPGCTHTIHFGAGKLITPNPINAVSQPTKLVFKRRGQSVQLLYDSSLAGWILLNSGCYVE